MTPRETYAAAHAAVRDIRAERALLTAPTEGRYQAALTALDEAEDAVGACCLGACETCGIFLFEGDRGHACTSGEVRYCAEHAPTFGYVLQQYERSVADGYVPESFEDLEELARAIDHLKTCDPDERVVHVL